jgi:hypothetical protein
MPMSCDDAGTSGVRRFEVFTVAGRRRDWALEVKASIVAEDIVKANAPGLGKGDGQAITVQACLASVSH